MDNKNINLNDLIQKYERMRYLNRTLYFDTDEFVRLAKHYKHIHNMTEAEHIINIALGVHPGSYEIMITKVKLLLVSKKYEEAFEFLQTMPWDETNVDLLLVKFECLLNLDKTDEAEALLDYILNGDLDKEKLYKFTTEVGYLYNNVEIFETSIMLLEKARKDNNSDMDLLFELVYAYEWNDNIDKAIEITNIILDLEPYSYDGWLTMGRLHSYNYETELSIEAFDFALAIKENDLNALQLKAETYNRDDNYEDELKVMFELLDASPDDLSLYDNLIKKYEEVDEYWFTDHTEEILKVLKKQFERFGPKGVLLDMGHAYLNMGKYEEAEEVFNRIPEEDKTTLKYYILKGEISDFNRDFKTAEASFLLALSLSPNHEWTLHSLSEVYFELENYEKAALYLDKLIAVDPEFPGATFRLGWYRFELGDKELFDKILELLSDDALALLYNTVKMSIDQEKRVETDDMSREELLILLDQAYECRVRLKNEMKN